MRMSPCPVCHQRNVNGFKKKQKWYSTCYNKECRFTTEVGMPTRKMSRYNWNRLYEHMTGETLPDEVCGRQDRAFMKKEIAAGVLELVDCFTQEDFEKWEKKYSYDSIDWVKEKGKKAGAKRRKERAKERETKREQ